MKEDKERVLVGEGGARTVCLGWQNKKNEQQKKREVNLLAWFVFGRKEREGFVEGQKRRGRGSSFVLIVEAT